MLIVAGGVFKNGLDGILSSTEVMEYPGGAWRETDPLPTPLYDLRGVTLNGVFYVTGGDEDEERNDGGHGVSPRILAWYTGQPPAEQWVEAGQMVAPRRKHGVTALPLSVVADLCK